MESLPVRNTKADRRSLRTRRLLSDALIALMMEKAYDDITVQDIIDRADVGRSTFYAHYQHKDDLLSSEFERLIEELNRSIDREMHGSNPLIPSLALFRHVKQHYPLYKALVWGRGLDFVVKSIQVLLTRSIEMQLDGMLREQNRTSDLLPVTSNYVAGTFLILLQWWLDDDMTYSPERMNEVFQQLVMPGVQAVLGTKL